MRYASTQSAVRWLLPRMRPVGRHRWTAMFISGLFLLSLGLVGNSVLAADPRDTFFQAQNCYEDLRQHPKKQAYRSHWFKCIEKFRSVYKQDPDGRWAAAGLYNTGKLYLEMYRKSYRKGDLREAQDLFRRITLRFPRSDYAPKAQAALAKIEAAGRKKAVKVPAAAPADSAYGQAQAAYERLKRNTKWHKYRDKWFAVIRDFEKVYKQDPRGPAAAPALYTTGELYLGLSKNSLLKSDQREAQDIFQRVVSRFDGTPYAEKARKQLAGLEKKSRSKKPATAKTKAASKKDLQVAFNQAEKSYRSLVKSKKRSGRRDLWKQVIRKYEAVYDCDPRGPWAAAGLFRAGECYLDLHKRSFRASDREHGFDMLAQVITEFPASGYSAKATRILVQKGREVPAPVAAAPVKTEPPPAQSKDVIAQQIFKAHSERKTGREMLKTKAAAGVAMVTGLRYWSNPSYTRIVIDADSEAQYTHHLLKKDTAKNKPQRLFVDLKKARLDRGTKRKIPINDNLLSDARAGQYSQDTVRVVVDIKSFKTYKIFPLKNPFRIVIDVRGQERKPKVAKPQTDTFKINGKVPAGAIARQLSLGVRRIVIDPGHGGRDFGAPGYYKGVHEKDIVLQIGLKLAAKLRKELGCEVLMTRTTDKYLTLEERTAFANTKSADLFISIHTNAHNDKRAYGIETYFLNLATDDEAIRVAAFENMTSTKNISDLQTILTDLMQNAKINESSRLAGNVQGQIYKKLRKHYKKVRSKGVKQAPFYVLLGAEMPAVLIETSFISNPRECKRLRSSRYQNRLSEGIVHGVKGYIKEINPTAFRKPKGKQG